MNEYRVTRDELYEPGSLGHADVTVRQGHYCKALNVEDLKHKVRTYFPKEKSFTYQEIVQGLIEQTVHRISLA